MNANRLLIIVGKPNVSFTKKVDSVHDNEEVELLQNSESESEKESSSDSEESGGGGEGEKLKVKKVGGWQ